MVKLLLIMKRSCGRMSKGEKEWSSSSLNVRRDSYEMSGKNQNFLFKGI
jgi:hypothetical protein